MVEAFYYRARGAGPSQETRSFKKSCASSHENSVYHQLLSKPLYFGRKCLHTRYCSDPHCIGLLKIRCERFLVGGLAVGSSETDELNVVMPDDYAKRMSNFQKNLAERRAVTATGLVDHRRQLRGLYENALTEAGLPTLEVPDWADPVLLRYPVRVPEKQKVLSEARRRHTELGDWFDHPLHPAGCNVAALGWRDGLCPEGEKAAQEVVNLPMHARIGPKQVQSAVQLLQEHCAGHASSVGPGLPGTASEPNLGQDHSFFTDCDLRATLAQ